MGDDGAFASFVAARHANLMRTGRLLTGDWSSAEDLVQQALVRAWPSWSRIANDQPEAYVRRIMLNLTISRWRSLTREIRRQRLAALPVSSADPGEQVSLRVSLDEALQRLPARQRAVVVLRYYEDLTEAQTADLLGCAIGTVKSQSSKALHRLRTDLQLSSVAQPVSLNRKSEAGERT